jgi:hypothetical protein
MDRLSRVACGHLSLTLMVWALSVCFSACSLTVFHHTLGGACFSRSEQALSSESFQRKMSPSLCFLSTLGWCFFFFPPIFFGAGSLYSRLLSNY